MTESKTTRRDVLKAAGVLGLGVTLGGCSSEDTFSPHKPPVPGSAKWARGEEKLVASSCGQCEAGCGVLVRVVEGRAVKVEGNPYCPINRGGIGPRGLSATQALYDPDRIQGPLLRTGARGSGAWKSITWDEALEALGTRLAELREGGHPEGLGVLCGRERGLVRELWQRFVNVYGTPNLFEGGRSDNGTQIAAIQAMQGVSEAPAYDWEHTRLVLSLGSGVLDTSCQNLHFASIRGRHADGGRATIIHVGAAGSRAAMNSDEWVSIREGTNAAFALSLAHILVRDELHDREFVESHCHGFEPWTDAAGREHQGFRSLLDEFDPVRVSSTCDVPAEKIEKVARVMARTRPCFAIAGSGDLRASNGVQTAMAVHALNALLGSIDRPGGLLVQQAPPLAPWNDYELDEIAEEGVSREPLFTRSLDGTGLFEESIDFLPDALLRAEPYALDTLLIDHANPVQTRAESERWRRALAKIPYVVSFSPYMDETTAECADLVLPEDTWLERWGEAGAAPSLGRAVFGVRQPVVERLYDTRATGDVLIGLAQLVGDGVSDAFSWKDYRSAIKKRVIGLYKAKSGSIVEKKGSKFLKRLYAEGFWAGDAYPYEKWERVLLTDSGRFEFFSGAIWKELVAGAEAGGVSVEEFARDLAGVDDPDLLCLPGHREFARAGDPARYPLLLIPYKPHTYARGSGANLPWLVELAAWRGRSIWSTEAELHPDTAAEYGLKPGDQVTLESPTGTIVAQAYLTRSVVAGCVRVAAGGGHTEYGRFAKGWGANVMQLVSLQTRDPFGGSSVLQGTRVSIRRNEA